MGRNTIWTIAKNMPRGYCCATCPPFWPPSCRSRWTLCATSAGKPRARLLGQLAGLAGLPRQLRKRQLIQPRRVLDDAELRARLVD
ncbi:MAG: hypothetical protein R2911_08335 [Caldilineaceae bacterium]